MMNGNGNQERLGRINISIKRSLKHTLGQRDFQPPKPSLRVHSFNDILLNISIQQKGKTKLKNAMSPIC